MKASEAKAVSDKIISQKEIERAERNEKAKLTRIANEKAKREEFKKTFNENIDRYIVDAVKEGHKSADIWTTGYSDHPVPFGDHEYFDIIKKTIKRLEDDGYTVAQLVGWSEFSTCHESSVPDRHWSECYNYLKVSW